jgi:signal transduction histidine kinase
MLTSLEGAEKLDAMSALAGAIAHDYNNFLTGILGNLELLQRRAAKLGLPSLDDYLNGARSAANRAAAFNQKLLAIAGHQPLKATLVSVNEVLTNLKPGITALLGTDCQLDLTLAADAAAILCDEQRLREAILEVAANAADAMPDGGQLTISTKLFSGTGDAGGSVVISVQDSGPGMSAEIAARAFEPFFSTRQRGATSGLGLAVVRGFTKQSGGGVSLECLASGGTVVKLWFPTA